MFSFANSLSGETRLNNNIKCVNVKWSMKSEGEIKKSDKHDSLSARHRSYVLTNRDRGVLARVHCAVRGDERRRLEHRLEINNNNNNNDV